MALSTEDKDTLRQALTDTDEARASLNKIAYAAKLMGHDKLAEHIGWEYQRLIKVHTALIKVLERNP